jgi:hypothetical protein
MKDADRIADWLRRKNAFTSNLLAAAALALLALGAVLTFLIFWALYLVLWLGSYKLVGELSHQTLLVLSTAAVLLLLVVNFFIDYDHFEADLWASAASDPALYYRSPGGGGGGGAVALLFLCGPRAVTASLRLLRRAWRLRHWDVAGCAAALSYLAKKDARVPAGEALAHLPKRSDFGRVCDQLRSLDGVLFLGRMPVDLSLSPGLRRELRELRKRAS